MEPEIIEQWQIRELASGAGYRAVRIPDHDPYSSLTVRLGSTGLEFECGECFTEEFPRAAVCRLFELLDSLEAQRDQESAALYEVERN